MSEVFSMMRERSIGALREVTFLAGLALLGGFLPALPPSMAQPAGCAALLLFLLLSLGSRTLLLALTGVLSLLLPLMLHPAFALFGLLPFALLEERARPVERRTIVVLAAAMTAQVFWLPQLYWIGEWLTGALVSLAALPAGLHPEWGSTTGVGPAFALLLIQVLAGLRASGKGAARLRLASLPLFLVLLGGWFLTREQAPANIPFLPAFLLLLLSALPACLAGAPSMSRPSRLSASRARVAGLGGLAALLALCWTALPPASTSVEGLKVAFRENGDWSWESTREGTRPGPRMGGLLDVLRAWGAQVDILEDPELAERMGEYDVIFVIHPTEAAPTALRGKLDDFMRDGGAVLVVGEHTNVHDIMLGVNSVISRSGIRLKDDSAIPAWRGWNWNHVQHYLVSGATRGMKEANQYGISIGGSLQLEWPALPVIQGTMAFSDTGNPDNVRGKMGDNRYTWDERFGSIPLCAMEKVGKGVLFVQGDTSGLMSLSTPQTWPFYLNLVSWLARGSASASPLPGMILWVLALGLLLAATPALGTREREGLVLLLCLLALPFSRAASSESVPAPASAENICWIDYSHQPAFHSNSNMDWSSMALVESVYNAGRLPLFLWDVDTDLLGGSRWLLVNGPGKTFSGGDSRDLCEWVEAGGHLLIAGDARRVAALEPLLEEFEMEIQDIPLGTAPDSKDRFGRPTDFLFYEAWPVASTGEPLDTLLSCWDFPVIGDKDIGRGHVTVIGDERFFSKYSLEGTERNGKPLNTARRFMAESVSRRPPPPGNAAKNRYLASWGDSLHRVAPSPPLVPPDRIERRKQLVHGLLNLPMPRPQMSPGGQPGSRPTPGAMRRPPGAVRQPATRPGTTPGERRRAPIRHGNRPGAGGGK